MSIALLAALCLLPMLAQAQLRGKDARYVITSATQLENEKNVRPFHRPYVVAATANTVYDQCGAELGITEMQRQFLKQHFTQLSNDYMKAFDDAFQANTQSPSSPEMLREYTRHLTGIQQIAVNHAAQNIKALGCKTEANAKLIDYYEILRKTQEAQKPATQTAPAAVAPAQAATN